MQRNRPDILNGSRKRRISMGSGTSVAEINRLLKQYKQMQKMMKGAQGKWLRRAWGGAGVAGGAPRRLHPRLRKAYEEDSGR